MEPLHSLVDLKTLPKLFQLKIIKDNMVGAQKKSLSNIASAINIIVDNKNISKQTKKFKKNQMCVMCVVCDSSIFRGTIKRTTRTTMGTMM